MKVAEKKEAAANISEGWDDDQCEVSSFTLHLGIHMYIMYMYLPH